MGKDERRPEFTTKRFSYGNGSENLDKPRNLALLSIKIDGIYGERKYLYLFNV